MSDGQDTDVGSSAAGDDRASIGRRLAAARKELDLDIRVVASELHLDTSTIEALETDDMAALPAAIFVKGYLRSYARLVGLPEEEIVSAYSAKTGDPPPLTVVSIKGETPLFRLPSGRLIRNVIMVLLAVILLWLAYPFAERLIQSRGEDVQAPVPGRLELPPAEPATTQ